MSAGTSAISVSGLTKTFGRRRALDGIAFDVAPGEMVALIGASGSGKSTLIRTLAGLEITDRGASSVEVLGRRLQSGGRLAPDVRALRREVGVVFQQFNLVSRLSVITNVLLGTLGRIPAWRGTLGLWSADERHLALTALGRVGIADLAFQRASTLSGGQQQRAAIARTLVQRSKILIADEPIASLDPASSRRVMDVLADINRRDAITVVVSLHQVEYARAYCPRTVALRAGKVVYDGPSTALTEAFLTELYGASSEELVLPAPVSAAPSSAALAGGAALPASA